MKQKNRIRRLELKAGTGNGLKRYYNAISYLSYSEKKARGMEKLEGNKKGLTPLLLG